MVLLCGSNYDYANQQSSIVSVSSSSTTLTVQNTEGFTNGDYILINPGSETSEITKVNATISSNTAMTVTTLKFTHAIGEMIYRLPYNQMKFYECSTATGTYAYVTSSAIEMTYSMPYTNYNYTTGNKDYYWKRTFYNSTTTTESDIALADYWQTNDEYQTITPTVLRVFLQFDTEDFPNDKDMEILIDIARRQVTLDVSTSNVDILYIANLLMSKVLILRALATKSVAKGYVTVNVQGRAITKAYQEFVLEAENTYEEYQTFIRRNLTSEVSKTDFMTDSDYVAPEVRQEMLDTMQGTSNAMYLSSYSRIFYGRRRRTVL